MAVSAPQPHPTQKGYFIIVMMHSAKIGHFAGSLCRRVPLSSLAAAAAAAARGRNEFRTTICYVRALSFCLRDSRSDIVATVKITINNVNTIYFLLNVCRTSSAHSSCGEDSLPFELTTRNRTPPSLASDSAGVAICEF